MKIGYARVSKDEQDLAPQLHALDAAGCEKVFQDQSGASAARPGLLAALEMAGEGDTLTVWRIDRLGRSTLHLLKTLDDLGMVRGHDRSGDEKGAEGPCHATARQGAPGLSSPA